MEWAEVVFLCVLVYRVGVVLGLDKAVCHVVVVGVLAEGVTGAVTGAKKEC